MESSSKGLSWCHALLYLSIIFQHVLNLVLKAKEAVRG